MIRDNNTLNNINQNRGHNKCIGEKFKLQGEPWMDKFRRTNTQRVTIVNVVTKEYVEQVWTHASDVVNQDIKSEVFLI